MATIQSSVKIVSFWSFIDIYIFLVILMPIFFTSDN